MRLRFRYRISEQTNHPSEVAEMALSHAVSDKVEATNRRGDLFQKLVALMDDWARFLDSRLDKGKQGREADTASKQP